MNNLPLAPKHPSTQAPHFFSAPNLSGEGTHRIAYYVWENSEATDTVFCVHGLTRNAHDFDIIATELQKTYRVISVDIAGRGKSEHLTDTSGYNYVAYMLDCLALLEQLGIDNVHWLGTSMGGIIGMMTAALHAPLVSTLVMNDIGAIVPASGLKRICDYAGTPKHFSSHKDAEIYLRCVMQPYGINENSHWQHIFSHSIINAQDDGFTLNYDPALMTPIREQTNNFTTIEDIDLSDLWKGVICPTLLIRGSESDILPQSVAEDMATKPNVTLHTIYGVGHAPALMSEDQILVIANFLKQ